MHTSFFGFAPLTRCTMHDCFVSFRLKQLVGGSAASVHCVSGEYDFASAGGDGSAIGGNASPAPAFTSFPETKVIQLGQFRVGIIGGHQVVPWGDLSALAMVRRRLSADVLVCGWRRKEGVVEHEGAWCIASYAVFHSLSRPSLNEYVFCFQSEGGHYIFPVSNDVLIFVLRLSSSPSSC